MIKHRHRFYSGNWTIAEITEDLATEHYETEDLTDKDSKAENLNNVTDDVQIIWKELSQNARGVYEVSRGKFCRGFSSAKCKSRGWRWDHDYDNFRTFNGESPSPSEGFIWIWESYSQHASPRTGDEALIRPTFVFFLLISPTFARTVNDPPSSSSSGIGVDIKEQKLPNIRIITEELTKEETNTIGNIWSKVTTENVEDVEESTPYETEQVEIEESTTKLKIERDTNENVKFIPIEGNLTNVSKNGAIENNFATKNKQLNLPTARSGSSRLESGEKGASNEPKFVKVTTLDGAGTHQGTLSRTLNPYNKTVDNISKILLYPVNGTTIVYRETTFKPILPNEIIKKTEQANNGQDVSYLPFSTWSKIVPEIIEEKHPEDDGLVTINESFESVDEVVEAANFGLEAMNDLYYIKEPKLFSMGLFLTDDNPGRYVAAFNDQTEEARQLARFGFAALEGARSFVNKHPDISRTETFDKDTRRTALHRQCPRRGIPPCPPASLRYRTTDGSCNNPNELWWGSAMSAMQRFLQPVYQDGIQTIRRSVTGRLLPSPREISSTIHQDQDIPLASVTHMLMQWGQFIDHDLTATGQSRGFNGTVPQCCLNGGASFQPSQFMHPECLPIPVPVTDNFYGPLGVRCLEFVRSGPAPREDCGFGPREQLSQVTSYLDASTVYSSNVQQSDSLRLFRNGLLQYGRIQSRKPLLPRQESDLCRRGSLATSCFRAGDGRLSEQPALISMHVIFLRQHNRIATELAALNQHWSDEKLFQETRRIIGALMQHITYREFLPIVLGPEVIQSFDLKIQRQGYYNGYDPTVNPNIANSFAAAAYRFGHSLVQHSFVRYDSNHRPIFNNVTIHDEFSNPINLETVGSVDRMLLGLINQPSQKRDEFITTELTNHLFQTSNFLFGMDLASLNIQRGRDHGIPPYIDWREPCGLSSVRKWEDLDRVMPLSAARKFRILYSSVADIDLFPAGLAEKPVPGGLVGPTFACIIAQQFSNLRKGDRFWYENHNKENEFTPAQLQQIKRVTLAQVICKTTENIDTIQPFVFLTPDTFRNKRVSCDSEIIGNLDLDPWAERAPLEQRSKSKPKNRRKVKVKSKTKSGNPPGDSNDGKIIQDGDNRRGGTASSEEKSFFPFFRPARPEINQQNKVVIRRPSDTHENLTILVQNHAVNSPVYLTESIQGSNFQLSQSGNGHTPSYGSNSRPVEKPQVQNDRYTSPRPIYYDDTQPNPVYVSQTSYRPTSKPKPRPKPKPPTYGNPAPYSGPYIPHGINDPSNPNPPNYGFVSRPVNNDVPSNSYFDTFTRATTQRPTLYTYYTTFTRPIVTQRPISYYQDQVRPQNHHQHDPSSSSQHQQSGYGASKPSTTSWSVTRPGYETDDEIFPENPQTSWTQRPIYDQSWTPETAYEQNWGNRPAQADPDEWSNVPAYNKPSYGNQANGYWTEWSASTKKYPSTSHYYDQEYQIQNSEANINPRPFKKQSVTIITDSYTDIHHPYSSQRIQPQIKNEVPRPLLQGNVRDESDIAQHKDAYEIDLSQIIDKRTKPGQFYYEKNVLHRYPEGNLTDNENINNEDHLGGYKNKPHGTDGVEIDRIVIDDKYQIERLDPNRGGGPGPMPDTETKAQVTRDEIKLTTTATIILDDLDVEDYEESDDDYDNVYDDEETEEEDEEEITGAYSEGVEQVVLPDSTFSPIEWIIEKENSSLILNPEQPNLVSNEFISTKEIPKPLKQHKPAS